MILFLKSLNKKILFLEKFFVSISLLFMVLLVFSDFIIRELHALSITGNLLPAAGIAWAKETAAFLMIWVGFFGASMAANGKNHLSAEILQRVFKGLIKEWIQRFSAVVAAAVCITLGVLSLMFVRESMEFGDKAVTLPLNIWIVQIVIPFSFFLMSLRFLGGLVNSPVEGDK